MAQFEKKKSEEAVKTLQPERDFRAQHVIFERPRLTATSASMSALKKDFENRTKAPGVRNDY